MKSRNQIYVEYEIGEIYPENLPHEIRTHLGPIQENEFLERIAQMNKPTRADIYPILYRAFEITESNRITKREKLDLLVNRWRHCKLAPETLFRRMRYFDLEDLEPLETLELFIKYLRNSEWTYSEEWDYINEKMLADFKIENRYAEFLLKENE